MKYCVKCGNQLYDEAVICPKCGCYANGAEVQKKNSGNGNGAIGLVFSLIGFIVGVLELVFSALENGVFIYMLIIGVAFGILGLIFGCKTSSKRKGLKVLSILFSTVCLLSSAISLMVFALLVM